MEDLEWIAPFYESVMRPYVEKHQEWDPNYFSEHFTEDGSYVIACDDQGVGYMKILLKDDHVYLGDIQLHKKFRKKGVGSSLINMVKQQAGTLPVRLRVLKDNPAIALYERLGFIRTEEQETCIYMQFTPDIEPTNNNQESLDADE